MSRACCRDGRSCLTPRDGEFIGVEQPYYGCAHELGLRDIDAAIAAAWAGDGKGVANQCDDNCGYNRSAIEAEFGSGGCCEDDCGFGGLESSCSGVVISMERILRKIMFANTEIHSVCTRCMGSKNKDCFMQAINLLHMNTTISIRVCPSSIKDQPQIPIFGPQNPYSSKPEWKDVCVGCLRRTACAFTGISKTEATTHLIVCCPNVLDYRCGFGMGTLGCRIAHVLIHELIHAGNMQQCSVHDQGKTFKGINSYMDCICSNSN